jgi:hypothetical protein
MTDYQKIRAAIEAPLLTAFNSQIPPVPVYFDNVTAVPPDPPKEYVRINVTFGLMSESSISSSLDRSRGSLVIRCFAPKGGGPARCQELVSIAISVVKQLGQTKKTDGSVFVRTKQINGPVFAGDNTEQLEPSYAGSFPHFVGRINVGWEAILPCV